MSQALEIYKNHQFYQTWQSFRDEFNKGYIPEQIDDTDRLKYYDIINKNIEFINKLTIYSLFKKIIIII